MSARAPAIGRTDWRRTNAARYFLAVHELGETASLQDIALAAGLSVGQCHAIKRSYSKKRDTILAQILPHHMGVGRKITRGNIAQARRIENDTSPDSVEA